MLRKADIGLGDVVRAWRALGLMNAHVESSDLRREIASALGIAFEDARMVAVVTRPSKSGPTGSTPSRNAEPVEQREPTTQIPIKDVPESTDEQSGPLSLVPLEGAPLTVSKAGGSVDEPGEAPILEPPTHPKLPPQSPIFAPLEARAILAETIRCKTRSGPVDIERAIRQITATGVLTCIPRKQISALPYALDLWADMGDTMTPFRRDHGRIARLFRFIVGRGFKARRFYSPPGAPTGGPRPLSYSRPNEGQAVIVVSDLGLTESRDGAGGDIEPWIQFGRELKSRRIPAIALVPVPAARVPARLLRYWRVVEWDSRTTVRTARTSAASQVKAHEPVLDDLIRVLSTTHIPDRTLVREVRKSILPGAHVALEAQLWQSDDVEFADSDRLSLRPEVLVRQRAQLTQVEKDGVARLLESRGPRVGRLVRALEELLADSSGANQVLRGMLATVAQEPSPDAAAWVLREKEHFPADVRGRPLFGELEGLCRLMLWSTRLQVSGGGQGVDWRRWLAPPSPGAKPWSLGVREESGRLIVCEPPVSGHPVLEVPATSPVWIGVESNDGESQVWLDFLRPTRGAEVSVPMGGASTQLILWNGERFRVERLPPSRPAHLYIVWRQTLASKVLCKRLTSQENVSALSDEDIESSAALSAARARIDVCDVVVAIVDGLEDIFCRQVGYALGRGKPVATLNLGTKPWPPIHGLGTIDGAVLDPRVLKERAVVLPRPESGSEPLFVCAATMSLGVDLRRRASRAGWKVNPTGGAPVKLEQLFRGIGKVVWLLTPGGSGPTGLEPLLSGYALGLGLPLEALTVSGWGAGPLSDGLVTAFSTEDRLDEHLSELLEETDQPLTILRRWVLQILSPPRRVHSEWETSLSFIHFSPTRGRSSDSMESQRNPPRPTLESLVLSSEATRPKHWLIFGEPGSGKSSLLRLLARRLAQDSAGTVPILVPLPRLAASDNHPFELAATELQDDLGVPTDVATELFSQASSPSLIWLLLDGLDAIAPNKVESVLLRLERWAKTLPHVVMVIMARPHMAPVGLHNFQTARLMPLRPIAQQAALLHLLGQVDGEAAWKQLKLHINGRLAKDAGSVLFMKLIADQFQDGLSLSQARVAILSNWLDWMVDQFGGDHSRGRKLRKACQRFSRILKDYGGEKWQTKRLTMAAFELMDDRIVGLGAWDYDPLALLTDFRSMGLLVSCSGPDDSLKFPTSSLHDLLTAEDLLQGGDDLLSLAQSLDSKTQARWVEPFAMVCDLMDQHPRKLLTGLWKINCELAVQVIARVTKLTFVGALRLMTQNTDGLDDLAWEDTEFVLAELSRSYRSPNWRVLADALTQLSTPAVTDGQLLALHRVITKIGDGKQPDAEFLARSARTRLPRPSRNRPL